MELTVILTICILIIMIIIWIYYCNGNKIVKNIGQRLRDNFNNGNKKIKTVYEDYYRESPMLKARRSYPRIEGGGGGEGEVFDSAYPGSIDNEVKLGDIEHYNIGKDFEKDVYNRYKDFAKTIVNNDTCKNNLFLPDHELMEN